MTNIKYFVGSHAGDGINGTACETWAEANELLTTQYGEDWQDSNELEIDPQESSFQV